ncbi:hypothetical protein [Geobacter sp. DSM 9736]|uniref:hypothetical protein n=1 Tax=Geobacter sp. DSM 9736 TaxID=1277350 RepID=UPI000B508D4B|nr:hypothetical protein [Geobacter sp. DSM 9736]SNB46682.1 hypothetical protein SAMN06269301_2152 [Geobacter sp. DSM 9736]
MAMRKYDEDREIPSPWEWVIITLFSIAIAAFGWFVYRIVPEGPRYWDVGQLPDTPAESIYSTEQPWESRAPQRQLQRLPEAKKGLPPKPRNEQLRERGGAR